MGSPPTKQVSDEATAEVAKLTAEFRNESNRKTFGITSLEQEQKFARTLSPLELPFLYYRIFSGIS